MKTNLEQVKALSTKMADSLATIDPNMDNGDEGKAFLRRMYKVYNQSPKSHVAQMPATPKQCLEEVAGKVIMVENLQDDIDKAVSFRDFFAKVYSQAYVNSLITLKDGLHSIVPGGLDGPIEDELIRIKGDNDNIDISALEINALRTFLTKVDNGTFVLDDSSLIEAVEPV